MAPDKQAESRPLSAVEPYAYPTDEAKTDPQEKLQDSYKLLRETSLVSALASHYWREAVDVGAGLGRYLPVFAEISRQTDLTRRLRAVEPDPLRYARLVEAANRLAPLERLKIEAVHAPADALRDLPPESLDLITCIQVLGHVPTHSLTDYLAIFSERLSRGGSLILAVPVHDRADASGDFFHIVDTRRTPNSAGFRREVAETDFNEAAADPVAGELPVRAFKITPAPGAFVPGSNRDLPWSLDGRIGIDLSPHLRISAAFLYSIHKFSDFGTMEIGDMLLKIIKD